MDDVSVVTASPTALTDKNLFAYCDNNPVVRTDNGGEFWEAILLFLPFIDGPLPIGDIIAAVGLAVIGGVAIYDAVTAPTVKTPTFVVKKPTLAIPKEDEKDVTFRPSWEQPNYWKAKIIQGVVVPMEPLTYVEARAWVAKEQNLLCRNHAAARAIVKFYPNARWESAHRGGILCGYLNHYHLNPSAHKNHIWYYGE